MKKVYIANDPGDAHLARDILNNRGIEAIVQGESLFGLRGGIPITPDTSPSVWIIDDSRVDEAVDILKLFYGSEEESY